MSNNSAAERALFITKYVIALESSYFAQNTIQL